MAILLALLVGIYFFSAVWGRGATSTTGASSDIASAGVTRRVIGDGRVEAIWNVPASAKGTVLALHGCSHSALDWFPRDESRCAQMSGAGTGAEDHERRARRRVRASRRVFRGALLEP